MAESDKSTRLTPKSANFTTPTFFDPGLRGFLRPLSRSRFLTSLIEMLSLLASRTFWVWR